MEAKPAVETHDVCVIVVARDGDKWFDAALSSAFAHAGAIELDVLVVDTGDGGIASHVESHHPCARAIRCADLDLEHANNRALEEARSRHVVFLRPDAEILDGSLARLVTELDYDHRTGLLAVREIGLDGSLVPTIRRFPSLRHSLAEALALDRVPGLGRALGERDPHEGRHGRRTRCDWASSAMVMVRRAALESAGWFDERLLFQAQQADLCWRLAQAGWRVIHTPTATVRSDRRAAAERMPEEQSAFARMQFARKHLLAFPGYRATLVLRYGLRARASRAALATVVSGAAPPLARR